MTVNLSRQMLIYFPKTLQAEHELVHRFLQTRKTEFWRTFWGEILKATYTMYKATAPTLVFTVTEAQNDESFQHLGSFSLHCKKKLPPYCFAALLNFSYVSVTESVSEMMCRKKWLNTSGERLCLSKWDDS